MKEYRYDKESNSYVPSDEGHSSHDVLISVLAWVMCLFDWLIVPLIISIVAMSYYKDKNPYLYETFRHTVNFQISLFIYALLAGVVSAILLFTIILSPLAIIILTAIAAFQIVIPIIGIVKASQKQIYRPHFTIPFV
mgnify:FL=1